MVDVHEFHRENILTTGSANYFQQMKIPPTFTPRVDKHAKRILFLHVL